MGGAPRELTGAGVVVAVGGQLWKMRRTASSASLKEALGAGTHELGCWLDKEPANTYTLKNHVHEMPPRGVGGVCQRVQGAPLDVGQA